MGHIQRIAKTEREKDERQRYISKEKGSQGQTRPLDGDEGTQGVGGCLMQDGCFGSQRLLRLQTRVREEIQLVAELPNVKEAPHGMR